jgi:hypothetical protein
MQLFKRPLMAKTYRSFILPATPLKTLMVDTMDLGKWAGGPQGRHHYVISMIDPVSRWICSQIAPQRPAPTPQDSHAVVINGLLHRGWQVCRGEGYFFESFAPHFDHSVRVGQAQRLQIGSRWAMLQQWKSRRIFDTQPEN